MRLEAGAGRAGRANHLGPQQNNLLDRVARPEERRAWLAANGLSEYGGVDRALPDGYDGGVRPGVSEGAGATNGESDWYTPRQCATDSAVEEMVLDEPPEDDRNDSDSTQDLGPWQFSLGSLFLLTAACAALLGIARMSPWLAYVVVGLLVALVTRGARAMRFIVPFVFTFGAIAYNLIHYAIVRLPDSPRALVVYVVVVILVIAVCSTPVALFVTFVLWALFHDD